MIDLEYAFDTMDRRYANPFVEEVRILNGGSVVAPDHKDCDNDLWQLADYVRQYIRVDNIQSPVQESHLRRLAEQSNKRRFG